MRGRKGNRCAFHVAEQSMLELEKTGEPKESPYRPLPNGPHHYLLLPPTDNIIQVRLVIHNQRASSRGRQGSQKGRFSQSLFSLLKLRGWIRSPGLNRDGLLSLRSDESPHDAHSHMNPPTAAYSSSSTASFIME